MKTKKRSLQISRHSSSNSFCFPFPKKSILKLTQKVPLKLVVFFEAVRKFVWKLVRSMLLWRAYIPLNLGICIALPQNKHGGGHMNDWVFLFWKDKLHSSFIASRQRYWNPSAEDRDALPRITNSELFPNIFEQNLAQS